MDFRWGSLEHFGKGLFYPEGWIGRRSHELTSSYTEGRHFFGARVVLCIVHQSSLSWLPEAVQVTNLGEHAQEGRNHSQ